MRRLGLLVFAFACGGGDDKTDAGQDATTDVIEEPEAAAPDVLVDAEPERAIWVASPTTLYKFDPISKVMTRVADFDCSDEPMIDLAMNAKEELFGITSESIVRIDKVTGVCTGIVRGAQNLPYATAFVPGTETWIGYKLAAFQTIDPDSGALGFVGQMIDDAGNQFQASGDIVSLAGGKTYVTGLNYNPQVGDSILEMDPVTGAVTGFDGVTGLQQLRGLAQWAGTLYMFSSKGYIYRATITDAGANVKLVAVTFDLGDAGVDASADADAASGPILIPFRGAAVTTRAPTQ